MGYVIEFTPKRKRDAEKNFSDFITFCQKLKYFGDDLDWNSGFWDISKYVEGIAGRNSDIRLWWSNVDCKAATKPGKRVLMIQPFLNFARGYIIHEQGCNPSKGGYDFRLKALRVLERAMVELTGEADVVKLNSAIFNRALQLIEEKYAKIMHARSQFDLEAIAKFLNEKHLVSCRFSWKGWIKHSLDWSDDSEAEANRKKKLPSKEALYALGGIFYDSKMPADEVVSSIMAILIAAPDRISECFRLPVNCEDVGIEVSIHGTHEKSYGLRWWPSKGGKPLVKPVLPSWVEITKKAIKKLNKHGKEAREMAKWYEENPDQLYLPEDLAYLRGQPLSKEDLRKLLGLPPNAGVRGKGGSESLSYFIRKHNLTKIKVPGACSRKGAYFHFQFAEFEEVILSMLPKFFPFASNEQYGHVKCSESLMVVPKGLLNTKRTVGPYRCMFEVLSYNQIAGQLRHIFARNGKFGPDGKPYRITTHQPRHMLNTLGIAAGMTDEDVAWWSGRKDTRQNAVYDHNPKKDKVNKTLDIIRSGTAELKDVDVNNPITYKEYLKKAIGRPALSTEYGCCVHDWAIEPCDKYRDCLNCNEHVCFKGDAKKTERIRLSLNDAVKNLDKAEKEHEKCVYKGFNAGAGNADRWVSHLQLSIKRLRQLVRLLDDPDVPEGTPIWLSVEGEYSQLGAAMDRRAQMGDREAVILSELIAKPANYAPLVPVLKLLRSPQQ